MTLLVIFPCIIFAQDCDLKDEKDRFNQDPRLTTGFKTLGAGRDKFLISITADKTEIDIFIALENSGLCFTDISRATVYFEGGKQRSTYKNGGTSNCQGNFHFNFRNQEPLHTSLTQLATKKVVSIQFQLPENQKREFALRPEDSDALLNMASCIMDQLASLRNDTWKPRQ